MTTEQKTELTEKRSIADLPPLDLGAVLRPLKADDDLLGEMLEAFDLSSGRKSREE
jgi:hypothetical protein